MVEIISKLRGDRSFLVPPSVEGKRYVQHYIRPGLNQIDDNDYKLISASDDFARLVGDGSFDFPGLVPVADLPKEPVSVEVALVSEPEKPKRGRPAKIVESQDHDYEESLTIEIP